MMTSSPELERTVRQTLLDRLIDREPHRSADRQQSRAASVVKLKESLRRDLEWLLNTRRIVDPAPPAFRELQRSLYHYGLPDITSLSADSPETPALLVDQIREAIEMFEPRLEGVRVTPVENDEKQIREIRLLIEGLLRMEPNPEQVAFDTVLEVTSGTFYLR